MMNESFVVKENNLREGKAIVGCSKNDGMLEHSADVVKSFMT